ncbi:MAG: glycosyltransferase [Archangiaceae bacterium]|nr:glycosyltransferase [Archangiaceae bacterium]
MPGSAGSIRDVHGNDVQFKLLKLEDEPQAGGARRTFYFFSDDTYFTPRRGLYNDEESQTAFGDAHARLLAGSALAGAAMSKVAALRKLGGGDRLTDAQVTAAEEHLEPTDVPDVIQYNDSHLAMLHPYLQHNEVFRHSAPLGIIHQGEDAYQTYIDRSLVERQLGELGGGFADALPSDGAWPSLANMMALTMTMGTVSHGYREQLLDSGTNLQSALQVAASEGRFFSYPNGVDLEATHPANFSGALTPYSADDLSGKVANKTALQKKLGLSVDARAPLFGFGNRIASQKGLQELVKVSGADAQGQPVSPLDTVLRENPRLQLVLGGPVEEPALVPDLEAFAARWPNNVRLQLGYVDNKELMAASDVFMMPSNEEPGGIAQIEAQNEGCAILATDAAGFLRSVPPYDARTGEGTGFIATRYDPASYTTALRNAVEWASKPPAEKAPVQRSAMQWAQNFDSLSWAKYQRALMRQAFVNHQDVLGA